MKSLRGQRLSSEYQKAVYEVISTKLKYKTDKIRGIVSVTKADVSPDLKNAKIYISVLGKMRKRQNRPLTRSARGRDLSATNLRT